MSTMIEIQDEGVDVVVVWATGMKRQAERSLERLYDRPETAARDDAIAEREREVRTAESILEQVT